MAHTNSTENYGLPQWIGTDKPTFLGDFNNAFATIDTGMKASSDVATAAAATANTANATATSAATNATNAISIANNAASEAASATSAASSATATANTAKTTADSAIRASASNTIDNLAPAYDPTLTYNVGDLVTFIDAQNSGKLYKCIVAVNTPMDFNINYWDDVTTSEAYLRQYGSYLLREVVADGVKDRATLFTELVDGIDFSNIPHAILTQVEGSKRTIFNIAYVDSTAIRCSSTRADIDNNTINVVYDNLYINNGVCQVSQCLTVDGTTSLRNDLSANVPNTGTLKYQILL